VRRIFHHETFPLLRYILTMYCKELQRLRISPIVEFILSDDFDGKLGFVFYQANLKDLQITAYYK
jgi:hypothetical protein